MSNEGDLYANRVIQWLDQVGRSMLKLHGRDLYNMYSLYAQELKHDIVDLVDRRYMTEDLMPWSRDGTVILPGFSAKSMRRMRYMWDYFIYLYMSHKFQNIKRRQLAAGTLDLLSILYLRGADYQLAITRQGAAVGHNTTEDMRFGLSILREMKERYNVFKALSPSDLSVAMQMIGPFLAAHGNSIGSVAEYARAYDDGFFFSPGTWKGRLLDLLPSSSLFLVYVSNQSNGLLHELESLAAQGLEANTILVLDAGRFGSRQPFFALQGRLKESGEDLYLSVDRDGCAVEDPAAFEELVARFPHTVTMGDDTDTVLREIERLIPAVRRPGPAAPSEFPFEFAAPLEAAPAREIAALRQGVDDFIENSLAGETVANWPVLRLHVEMDIFLSLASGEILKAAVSTARFAAMADFMRDLLARRAPERSADFDAVLRQCGDIGMDIAYRALAMGEWNDYSDRRELAKNQARAVAGQVTDLMRRSLAGAEKVAVQEARPETPIPDPSHYSDLMARLLDALGPRSA